MTTKHIPQYAVTPCDSVVISPYESELVKQSWRFAKIIYGQKVQVCELGNNSIEIQAAIDELPYGGQIILIGVFDIFTSLYLHSGITICGMGKKTKLVSNVPGGGGDNAVFTTRIPGTYDHITIMNLWIYGATGLEEQAIYFHGPTNYYKVFNVIAENMVDGISSDIAYGGIISGCTFLHLTGYAVYVNDLYTEVVDSYFEDVTRAFRAENGDGILANCEFYNIGVGSTSNHAVQIAAAGAYNINWVISSLLIDTVGGHGVSIGANTGATHVVIVTGCRIMNVGNAGITTAQESDGCVITSNNIKNAFVGIYLGGSNHIVNANDLDSITSIGIALGVDYESQYCRVSNNGMLGTPPLTGIREGNAGATNFNSIHDNTIIGTTPLVITGAGTKYYKNQGYITENSGSATVLNTTTSIKVAHGLSAIPTRVQITSTGWGNATRAWISSKDSDGDGLRFTISVDADPGITGAIFDWRAVVGEGN